MNRNQLILASIIAFIIFMYSLDITLFSGYSILMMIVLGIMLYFGVSYIFKMFESGKSLVSIIIFMIIIGIISIFVWGGYTVYLNKQKINKQWPQYRCKPYILPFAGWAIGPSGTSGTSNFINCMWNINKTFFEVLMSPFNEILEMITKILKNIIGDIQNIRKMITYMRDNLEEIARDALQKIWDAYERIAYLFRTILRVFEKLGNVFKDLFDVLLYGFYTLASIWNGPIGGIADFFCFDGNTLINMNNNMKKKIKYIKLNEKLEDNNKVIGKIKFMGKNTEMYNYKGVIISGEHLVKENGKWLRIMNSKLSKKLDKYDENIIYCLITENAKIKIGDIIFSDYVETDNKNTIEDIYNYILNLLNKTRNKKYRIENECIEMQSGLEGKTKIMMINGEYKKIKDIKINDETYYGKVLSKSKIMTDNKYKYKDTIMSGNIIINKENIWIPICNEVGSKKIESNKYLYNIITNGSMIQTDKFLVRDFGQINDKNTNKIIDKYILLTLN